MAKKTAPLLPATDELLRARMARRVRDEALAIGTRLGDPFWAGFATTGPRRVRRTHRASA